MPLFDGRFSVAFALAVTSHASVIDCGAWAEDGQTTDGDVLKGATILFCEMWIICMQRLGLKRDSEDSHSRYRKGSGSRSGRGQGELKLDVSESEKGRG